MVWILYVVFALSGAASLAFEALWFRQAGLTFGNSVWASSLVLSSFMAGIALGNGIAARYAARLSRPILAYALLEVVIALSGVGLVWTLPSMTDWTAAILGPFFDRPWILNPLRLAIGFFVLLVPATAMGATLPLVVRALHARDANFGAILGRLYGTNTLGAMVGAVIGELFLIAWLGVRGSALFVGGLGLMAALGATFLAQRLPSPSMSPAPSDPSASEESPVSPRPAARIPRTAGYCLAAAFLSGSILLAFEVVWFRFLHLFAHGGGLSFALMLATVLMGIGLGGHAAGAWMRRDETAFRHASALAFSSGGLAVAVYWAFDWVIAPYREVYVRDPGDILWLTFFLTFPPSFLSGVLFTFMVAMLEREIAPDSRATGLLTLFNTFGAGLGSICAGFILLPFLGMERSFYLLAAAYGIVGLLLWRGEGALGAAIGGRRSRWAAALAFVAAMAFFPSGAMERDYLTIPVARYRGTPEQIAETREGPLQTITYLHRQIGDQTVDYRLITDGYSMAGTGELNRRYMRLFAYWPVAIRPDPRRALLISYGVGETASALVETASLEQIDVVDISRAILESSKTIYPDPETHPLNDPRVQIHVEDGRYFLKTTENRYDLITGEPPPPKIAGVTNLYTREYFQLVYDCLEPGGLNTYWLPVHDLLESDTKAIIAAYCEVFSDCALWSGTTLDWMLTGSRELEAKASVEAFTRQWRDPVIGRQLRTLGIDSPELMGTLFMADAERLRELTADTPPLVDDFPKRISNALTSDKMEEVYAPWMNARAAQQHFAESEYIARIWPDELREGARRLFPYQQILIDAYSSRGVVQRIQWLHRVLAETPYRNLALKLVSQDDDRIGAIRRLIQGGADESRFHRPLGADALADRDFESAAEHYRQALKRRPRDNQLFTLYFLALCMSGDSDRIEAALPEASRRFRGSPEGLQLRRFFAETFDLDLQRV